VTIDRLHALQREGRPIELVVFPRTDHGIVEFVDNPDGTRTVKRVADGYFRLLGDWVKQERHPSYFRSLTPWLVARAWGPPPRRDRSCVVTTLVVLQA
jgi:hypothetical protein